VVGEPFDHALQGLHGWSLMGSWLLALLIQLAFSDYSGQTYYKIVAWGDRD
jgi:hypothetical protein